MEKKTIGAFIAALRKANGMTQKDLAEKLNVSDKTVSRWERNDSAPDLSVIPVIAEIFGVTCDELLRGERRPAEERTESTEAETTAKGEKQKQRLLKSSLSQYRTRTYISMGISVIGMIAVLIGNLAFLKAVLGFLLGAVFFAVSVMCQAIFINRAFNSVEDAEINTDEILKYKYDVIMLGEKSFGLNAVFTGFASPLVMMDAYVGVSADNMFIFGIIGVAIALAVYSVVCFFVNGRLLKNGVCRPDAETEEKYFYNRNLKLNIVSNMAIILVFTMVVHFIGSAYWWSASAFADGIVFNDYESFIAYMEQDIPYPNYTGSDTEVQEVEPPAYYNANGEEITEEEAKTEQLYDINHNVVCEYVRRNHSVTQISYESKEGDILPIRVRTYDDLRQANAKGNIINVCFFGVYVVEITAAFVIYFRKRAR
ncbi:MAG: helix-turn-helix transcriptional regulator [Clostridia bacterium]|nr:helix-turn-helix transcriptional regulator [Clostridia bacterium]